jgi:hypothetical protein
MPEVQLPPILYKYISWNNEHQRKILTENMIFFSSACKFNDPFDSSISMQIEQIENMDDDKALEYIGKYIKLQNPTLKDAEIKELANKQYDKTLLKDPENIISAHNNSIDLAYEDFGIFSLSEVSHNILMWSHYANSHRGICIGFDTAKLKQHIYKMFEKHRHTIEPYKVIYQTDYPTIDPNKSARENFLNQFTVKSIDWCYEKEWRYILFDRTNKAIEIPNDVISEIILGSRIPRDHRIEIIEILREQNMDIRLLQSWVSLKKFKLQRYHVLYYIKHN